MPKTKQNRAKEQAAGCPGGPDAWPRPPAGLPSAIADRLIPRRNPHHGKRWR